MTVTSAVRENLSKSDAELNDVVNTCDIIHVLDDLLNKAHTDFDDTRHADLHVLTQSLEDQLMEDTSIRAKSLITDSINRVHTEASSEVTPIR